MTVKQAEPEMTPEAETIIKTYYAMSRQITESSGRHITVRQLESTVRLAQGIFNRLSKLKLNYFCNYSSCKTNFLEAS